MSSLLPTLNLDRHALFLDIDGTLLEFQARPDAVRSPPELRALLSSLFERMKGALALVSGRPITDIDRVFHPEAYPAAGGHGVELRFEGGADIQSETLEFPKQLVESMQGFVSEHEGLLLEVKPAGIALHYRQRPELQTEIQVMLEELSTHLDDRFTMLAGKMVVEFLPRGYDKGTAVETFLKHSPFAGRCPVFIGDDVTDEKAFAIVNHRGGHSIRVGGIESSAATCSIDDVAGVHRWLQSSRMHGDRR